ncbi:MAG: hypothetical protein U5L08_07290 [Xanthomonadales bacterium]|nr:hypothetical protein [Xanthomonadales bacterium]
MFVVADGPNSIEIRHETEQAVVNIAASFDDEFADILAYRINERQKIQKKQDARYVTLPGHGIRNTDRLPERIQRTDHAVDEIFSAIGEEFSEPEAAILAHNTVASTLIWASRQNLYQGPIHWPWMPLRPLDISPFTPGIFRACAQIRSLREHFEQLGNAPVSGRILSKEHAAGTAALALAIFGGIDDADLLEELITGDCAVYPVPAIPDAIVVHSRRLKHTSGFRGIAALAYLTWRRTAQNLEELPEPRESLMQMLPTEAYSTRTNIVRALCSTVSMTNRIERSGMANYALDLEDGCTCLEEDQLAQLLGSECDVLPEATEADAVSDQKKVEDTDLKKAQAFDLRGEYDYLKHMYNKSEDVPLHYSGHLWRYDYANKTRERNKIVEEARLVGEDENLSWFGRYWANWIANELTRPKLTDPENLLAYSTVFGGLKEAANRMRKLLAERSEKHLRRPPNTDFLEELYQLILEDAPASTQQRICRTILRFHERVALDTGIDDVDVSNYWAYWRPRRLERAEVRTRIPMTSDLEGVEAALLRYAETDSTLDELGNIDRRLTREALFAYRLAMDSGARIGEITGFENDRHLAHRRGNRDVHQVKSPKAPQNESSSPGNRSI